MILVCGEALVDLVEVEADAGGRLLRPLPGGGPANTAVALARLGQGVGFVTRLGDDPAGALIRAHLSASGIDLRYVVTAGEPTTLALVTLEENGDARYSFYFACTAAWAWQRDDPPADLPRDVEAVHVASMALAAPDGYVALSTFVERVRETTAVALDPNVRAGVVSDPDRYRRQLEDLVARCHLVRASDEDLAYLYPGTAPLDAARRLAALGPRLVVVTRGARAPLAVLGETVLEGPSRRVALVDTVGAGDTFVAGLLHVLAQRGALARRLEGLGEETVVAALAFAATAAGITCERRGADPPRADEVAARLASG